MSSSQQLYQRINAKLQSVHPTLHQKRLAVWVWVIVGLMQSQSVHLSAIANRIPGPTEAAGRSMRIRCWLASPWTRTTATAPAELCVVMTNLAPSGWVLRHCLKRMHIEESFRDDKSGGFDLHASHLADPSGSTRCCWPSR